MLENADESSLMISRIDRPDTERKDTQSNIRASMRQVQREIKKNLKSFAINTDGMDEEEDSLMMTQFIDLEQPS